jgi:predicted PurR-regulated permease PerM
MAAPHNHDGAEGSIRRSVQGPSLGPLVWRNVHSIILLGTAVLVVAILYWLQAVLIPVALATLLTFLLTPVVGALHRLGLNRTCAVFIIVVVSAVVLGAIGWTLTAQVTGLANDLPKYRDNIRQRIADLRGAHRESSLAKVEETVRDVMSEAAQDESRPSRPTARGPVPPAPNP